MIRWYCSHIPYRKAIAIVVKQDSRQPIALMWVISGNENGQKYTLWPESVSELYLPSDRRLSAKLVPTFVDRGCHMFSVMGSHGHILGFLDRSSYFFYQVGPQLYSWGWVDPVPDTLLVRKSGSAGNRTRTFGSVARNSDHLITESAAHEEERK
jgi:hypothetical protein